MVEAGPHEPDLLTMTWDDLVSPAGHGGPGRVPGTWRAGGHELALDYVSRRASRATG